MAKGIWQSGKHCKAERERDGGHPGRQDLRPCDGEVSTVRSWDRVVNATPRSDPEGFPAGA